MGQQTVTLIDKFGGFRCTYVADDAITKLNVTKKSLAK